ncbi:putative uncharacterized protein [Acholeplasma sp. CAG:878]|nr:putative uncharacterized protein [Acholeplasma sp. CAG:878]
MSKVYFSKIISEDRLVDIYKCLNKELKGNVAVKVHSGEEGNQNYLKPQFLKKIIDYVDGTVVECNTAYEGSRNESKKHKELINKHGFNMYKFDLLDEFEDIEVEIPDGKVIKKNYLGKNILKYDSMLVISHFKGHPMGGYGGALKQLSIGCASTKGKCYIHSAGATTKQEELWNNLPEQKLFLESMADASKSVVDYFKGNILYINVMCNLSVDCDCCAKAEDPCMSDIGILASIDPVALDKACLDLIYNSNDPGKKHFIERVESRYGVHTIEAAHELKIGDIKYELIDID